jgi:predicted nucleic acid-binding protein
MGSTSRREGGGALAGRVGALLTEDTVDHGGDLCRQWHPSHGIDVNDAILAATVAATSRKIYTQNLKHYPMPDIAVLKGW